MAKKYIVLKSDLDIHNSMAFTSYEGKFNTLNKAKKYAHNLMKLLKQGADSRWIFAKGMKKNKCLWMDVESDAHRTIEVVLMEEYDIDFISSGYSYTYTPTKTTVTKTTNGKYQPADIYKKDATDLVKKDNTSSVGNFKKIGMKDRQDDTEKYQKWLKDRSVFYNKAIHTNPVNKEFSTPTP